MIQKPLHFNGNDISRYLLKVPATKLDIQAEKSCTNEFGIYHDMYWLPRVQQTLLLGRGREKGQERYPISEVTLC
jgi:hypothetical protein